MAGESWWDWRSPDWRDWSCPILGPILRELHRAAYKNIRIFDQMLHKQAPDTAFAAINTGVSHYFDGTSTSDEVDIKSASANDAAAGTGMRTAMLLGHASNDWLYESITLNGTTAVSSTTKFERFNAVKGLTWGSGATAAGAITMHEDGGTTETYATIAASTSFSATSRFYIPTNWNAFVGYLSGRLYQASHATSAFVLDTGAILKPVYALTSSYTPALARYYNFASFNLEEYKLDNFIVEGGDDSYIDLQHITKEEDLNAEMYYHYKIVCYGTGDSRGF